VVGKKKVKAIETVHKGLYTAVHGNSGKTGLVSVERRGNFGARSEFQGRTSE
jgi:hypothetical protein